MYSKDFLRSDFHRTEGTDCNLDRDGYIDYLEDKLCSPLQNTSSNSEYMKKPTALEFARICTSEEIDPMTSGLIYNLFFT